MKLFGKNLNGPPLIVSELSGNHNGSIQRAFDLIDAAKKAGADAVKFQVYEPYHLTIKSDRPEFIIKGGPWDGKTLFDLYYEAQTPLHWAGRIMHYARLAEIPAFPSVFSPEVIPYLEEIGVPAYKIASFEITDIPLIKAVAATGKPVIISTGMASFEEIQDALTAAVMPLLLHCVSGYPTPVTEANLDRLDSLITQASNHQAMRFQRYDGAIVGISDHSPGHIVPVLATALGAKLIEKHLCLSRADGGPDAAFSMEPDEFREMVQAVHDAWAALQPSPSPSEDVNRQLRRSLYVVKDVKTGEPFTTENIRSIRPANGMAPKRLEDALTFHARRNIEAGTPLTEEMFDLYYQTKG